MSTFKRMEMNVEDLACWGLSEDLQELIGEFLPNAGDNWDGELELGSLKGLPYENVSEGNALPTTNAKETITDFPISLWEDLLKDKIDDNAADVDIVFNDIDSILENIQQLDNEIYSTTEDGSIASSSSPAYSDFSNNSMTPPLSPSDSDNKSNSEIAHERVTYKIEALDEPITPPRTPDQSISVSSEVELSNSSSSPPSPKSPAHGSKPYSRRKRHSTNVQPKTVNVSSHKKVRKRDQNRDAATRYRTKKKAEADLIRGEETVLEEKNQGLKDRVESLSSEIKYLKGLLKEIIIAKIKS